MRIQLIHPPAFLNPTALTALRPSLPLGLAYIAGSLRAAGHEVSVLDAVGAAPARVVRKGRVAQLGLEVDEIVARLDPQARMIGVTSMFTYQWNVVRELLHAIKRARPDALLVGGGEHFTGLPEFSLKESPVDVLVLGEGEETIVALAKRYEDWTNRNTHDPGVTTLELAEWMIEPLAGTAWRKGGEIVVEERRARMRDVDSIPQPAWDLFDVRGYDENGLVTGIHRGITVPILATRGCPYRCAYCSSPNMWTTKWVARDPKLVADEIEGYVRDYGAANFPFHDLTAILKREWVIDFCKEIVARGLKINWQLPSGTRCEVVDGEVAALLAQSGGWSLNFAPESGSDDVRRKVHKQMTEKSLFGAVDAAVKHGLNTSVFFVLGFPGDRVQDFRATAKWAARLAKAGVDDVAVGFFFPIPGTQFYRELVEQGRLQLTEQVMQAPLFVHDRWLTEDRNFSVGLKARTLTWWRYRIVFAFYLRAVLLNPRRWARLWKNFRSGREDSKLDSFLQILKERFFTRRAAKA